MSKPTDNPPALAVRGITVDHVKADLESYYACVPCRTLKQARALAKVANMSRQEIEQYAFKVLRKNSPHVSRPWQRMAAGIFADIVTAATQLGGTP